MRRRIAVLLSAVLAAGTLAVVAPTTPAAADTDVCTGLGSANVGAPGLYYPGFPNEATGLPNTTTTTSGLVPLTTTTRTNVHGGQNLLPFNFVLFLGTCVAKVSLTATGLISGWCGQSWGVGVTNNGHRFAWVDVGGVAVVTGELAGTISMTPDALAGESCTTGALAFIWVLDVALYHCTVTKTKTDTLVSTETHDLRTVDTLGVHTFHTHVTTRGGYHVWTKVCV